MDCSYRNSYDHFTCNWCYLDKHLIFSCIIPASAKDAESQNLKDLITSIKAQDFPQDQIEILVITEGDSESAKAIGIRRAKGEICAMFCADNYITDDQLFKKSKLVLDTYPLIAGCYPPQYAYIKDDNSLNRYFSLIGGNDPICYYLCKNDRYPHAIELTRKTKHYPPSYGCNGFFYRANLIKNTDLDHYYPMDNAKQILEENETMSFATFCNDSIWHRTSDNLISFLKKRYRYARDLFSDRQDRRWKIIDGREDRIKLVFFAISTVTIIPCLITSIRGFLKIRDWAWFFHWPVCVGFLITYSILALRNLFKHGRLFQIKCPSPV